VMLAAAAIGALCSSEAVRTRTARDGLVPALDLR